ncbi:MAG: hypothetical protein ACE3JQ_12405 [Paenisporosarcina sp.]
MLDKQTLNELEEYIQFHMVIEDVVLSEDLRTQEYSVQAESFTIEMEDFIKNHRQPTLNQVLFRFIDKKGESDTEIYKKAGIDRRHFSKIRSNPDYRPGKNTTIALALALQLNKKDTDSLLSSAGYSLSDSNTFDLIIQYCLEHQIHDMYSVNLALEHYNQKTL